MKRLALAGGLLGIGVLLLGAGGVGAAVPAPALEVTPMPSPVSADAQLEDGESLYNLYCITCHGDRLYGLDPAWIAQWPADRQNCWQSKCHMENYPPDGFALPREVPALAGPGSLTKFGTAADLHAFINVRMPFQEPGRLTEDEYWAMVAYILRHNDIGLGGGILTAANAGSVLLQQSEPAVAVATPFPAATPTQTPAPTSSQVLGRVIDSPIGLIAVILGAAVGVLLFLRRRPRAPRNPP